MKPKRKPPTMTHDKMVSKWMRNPAFKAEYERIEREEMSMLDAILAARKNAKLTQAQVAKRMGTKAPAVARLENALITGTPSPSLNTLRKYAAVDQQIDYAAMSAKKNAPRWIKQLKRIGKWPRCAPTTASA